MFILTEIEEDVRVLPSDLSLPPLEAVTEVIEKRFLDKVRARGDEGIEQQRVPHGSSRMGGVAHGDMGPKEEDLS